MTRIRWTEPAEADFFSIYQHIAQDDRAAAERVGNRLLAAVESLRDLPRRGRPGRVPGTREMIVPGLPWLIVYVVRDPGPARSREVVILRLIHGARHWPA